MNYTKEAIAVVIAGIGIAGRWLWKTIRSRRENSIDSVVSRGGNIDKWLHRAGKKRKKRRDAS